MICLRCELFVYSVRDGRLLLSVSVATFWDDGVALVLPQGMPGFELGQKIEGKCGMRASMTAELVFDGVEVSASAVAELPGRFLRCRCMVPIEVATEPSVASSFSCVKRQNGRLYSPKGCAFFAWFAVLGSSATNTRKPSIAYDVDVPCTQQVGRENLVGNENGALLCMMRNLEIERVTLAAMGLGIAR